MQGRSSLLHGSREPLASRIRRWSAAVCRAERRAASRPPPPQRRTRPAPPSPREAVQQLIKLAQHPDTSVGSVTALQLLSTVEGDITNVLPALSTADVCSLLWAAARLQVQPDDAVLAAIASELTRPGYRSAAAVGAGGPSPRQPQQQSWAPTRAGVVPPAVVAEEWRAGGQAAAGHGNVWAEWGTGTAVSSGSSILGSGPGPPLPQQQQQEDESAGLYSYSRLQLAGPRDLGAVAYAFDFFKFNDPVFWAAAAEAALAELPGLAPNVLTNLLTGVAHSTVLAARRDGFGGAAVAATTTPSGNSSSSSSNGAPASLRRGPGALIAAPTFAAPAVHALLSSAAALLTEEPHRLRRFRPRDLASLLAAYATASFPAPPLFSEVARQLVLDPTGRRLAGLRARDAALLAWASVHALCPDRGLLAALGPVLRRRASALSPAHAALVLWAYAAASPDAPADEEMLRAVCAAAAGRMHLVHATVAASVVWSLGKLMFATPALMEDAVDRVAAAVEAAGWSAAAATAHSDTSSNINSSRSDSRATETSSKSGDLQQPAASPSVLEQLLSDPALRDSSADDDGYAGMLSSDAMPAATTPAAATAAHGRRDNTGSSDVAPPWAVSIVSGATPAPPLLPEDLVHTAWGCARLQHWNGGLLAALTSAAPSMLASEALSDFQVVALLWSLARLRCAPRAVLGLLCDDLVPRCTRLSSRGLATVSWSAAALRQFHPALLQGLGTQAIELATEGRLRPRDAVLMALGLAELQAPGSAPVFAALAQVIAPAAHCLPNKLIVNALWAFAVAGHLSEALYGVLYAALARLDPKCLHNLALMQLAQADMVVQDAYRGVISCPTQLSPHLRMLAQRQWRSSIKRGSAASAFQRQVVDALRQLGVEPVLEVLTRDGMFCVDVAVTWKGRRFAVEVDGPHHFTLTRPYHVLGRTAARRRCLQARGFWVLSVPFFDWREVTQGDAAADNGDQSKRLRSAEAGRAAAVKRGPGGRGTAVALPLGALERQAAYLQAALDGAAGLSPLSQPGGVDRDGDDGGSDESLPWSWGWDEEDEDGAAVVRLQDKLSLDL